MQKGVEFSSFQGQKGRENPYFLVDFAILSNRSANKIHKNEKCKTRTRYLPYTTCRRTCQTSIQCPSRYYSISSLGLGWTPM